MASVKPVRPVRSVKPVEPVKTAKLTKLAKPTKPARLMSDSADQVFSSSIGNNAAPTHIADDGHV